MNQLFIVRDYLRTHVPFLNDSNCDVDNITVFDAAAISSTNDVPCCVVISLSFSDEAYQPGDFNNQLFDWRILVNFFYRLYGNKQQEADNIQDGYVKAREIIDILCADFSLDGNVLDCKIHAVNTPMTYSRSDRDEYFMVGLVLQIKEALNG